MSDGIPHQGAVGQVRLLEVDGRTLVEKRMPDTARHDVEVFALRALADSGLPVPQLIQVEAGRIVMTRLPGERLDSASPALRLRRLADSAALLRRLHDVPPPAGLPSAPDDERIVRRYRNAGGPPLPFATSAPGRQAFCHGDWTDGNLLAAGERVTGIVDWEAAHVGDPMRELSRAAWGASRKDPASVAALVGGYGVDEESVRRWFPLHAAELWLWFAEAGPPAYLDELTVDLENWPSE